MHISLTGQEWPIVFQFCMLRQSFFCWVVEFIQKSKSFSNADVSATTMQPSLGQNWDLKILAEKLIKLF